MQDYQREFLDFALDLGVLRFGEFTLKSGRVSPYFFNAGLFNTGAALARLGRFYAKAIVDSGIKFDVLYGPAYKGIPLVAAAGIALADLHNRDLPWCFNRKEAKDHGEGGNLVGAGLDGRILQEPRDLRVEVLGPDDRGKECQRDGREEGRGAHARGRRPRRSP